MRSILQSAQGSRERNFAVFTPSTKGGGAIIKDQLDPIAKTTDSFPRPAKQVHSVPQSGVGVRNSWFSLQCIDHVPVEKQWL